MFRHLLKIMLRQLWKNKAFTAINLLGLATGMAVCLLLVLYIQNELGWDAFHTNGDQIYRLAMQRKYPGRTAFRGGIPQSIGQAVKAEFPEVRAVTRVYYTVTDAKVKAGEKNFTKETVLLADSNFFSVFTGEFLQGDATTALQHHLTTVVTESTAKRYFGSAENALGKTFSINEGKPLLITGVIRDWPEKSHLSFNVLLSATGMQGANRAEYVYFGPYTYLLLDKQASAAGLQAKLPQVVDKYVAPVVPPLFGESWKQFIAEGNGYAYFLQPIKDIHLHSILDDEMRPAGSMRNIVILGCIGAFILLLACVNFVNLSTALAVQRAREVGIRKTFGSQRIDLIRQFLVESLVFSLAGLLLALLLTALFTPLLNNISGQQLSFGYFLDPVRLLLLIAFSLFIGVIAGVYPAFVLSSFDPIEVLKGRFRSGRRGIALRNGLVVFQFAISVILIICTIVVNRQMQFMLGDSLGFRQDHVVAVDGLWQLRGSNSDKAFVDAVAGLAGVDETSKCSQLPGDDDQGGGATWVCLDNNASRTQRDFSADEHYQHLLDLPLQQGRFFSKAMPTDSLSVILNEQAVADFGLKNPLGARLICKEAGWDSTDHKQNIFTVIGVMKDYHYQSLRKKIAPLIIYNADKFPWGSVAVSIKGDHFKTSLAAIEKLWHRFDPKHDFRFRFLDRQIAEQYKAEQTEQTIFTIFSTLAILIACVGLLGLAAFTVRQRTKEMSIRKVLGAMPSTIILILSKDFLVQIGIAALIAFPIAWWAMHAWLQNFAYRVTISWWVFILAASLAALIAMLTISFQTIKAAIENPVKNLQSE
ncbi:ABC transporter permease [Puia dinghuensis]|uniref:ABC transporter permease n=1 Tax=Puia dinghuensis TaxID=1792502 RepID=A0A8J2UJC0_9BACT|nr:FtsX-like permease family protein [Puia dinghuensis]GGB25182.1 ABC transporter permease [Puia dinghuensis]